ncbi:dimethylsulfonioproprionate lyase family protein [Shinella sumterensis]|uniref:dimethylsulfonioproprionate lyase family protein n=1 Tax=Shinella sumterensis TaxID=1967501 RepID=UPI003F87BFC5
MMPRSDVLQGFLDAIFGAFDDCVTDARARASITRIVAALKVPHSERQDIGRRLPVCEGHLTDALSVGSDRPSLRLLLERFRALEPLLEWKTRPHFDETASDNFAIGHANTMIVGPGGLEDRPDIWLGVSLLAPQVRYPDHDHAPEETYLVMSDGEFLHGESGWFSPGVGGTFYNPPGIRHAMRSGGKPLFAFWALLPDRAKR